MGTIVVLTVGQTAANPSTGAASDPLGRDTPYGTVFGFLQTAQSGNYSTAAQYLQMSAAKRPDRRCRPRD